ncbi:EAL domain-containing protein [Sulfurirhabdus autotrophica]|uniref:Diguanylate cyclase DosC n=1 Tax=Sulfurirhabdus autotrophica TaxID=1706046 RepID=A0A4R3YEQ8_9PROT|nr:EAL domain-containing protein [Sulfurirhabdus autotrophica]TCV89658.1 PAS domain S-box-containing protein/diguanylate cyclase (GGDEF)-like protein [Sulfurirhabdus autotrophica]
MKDINEAVEALAREMGLDQEEIAQRESFLEITPADIALLKQIHERLEQESYSFADSFYSHLLEFPQLRTLLPDVETINRLRASQSAYFSKLTQGDYGPEYVKNRLRVGLVHQRIGLEPKWYLGAYRKYLSDLMPVLWRTLADEPEKVMPTYDALLKIVSLDMGLALDTYFQADRQVILQHQNYAEQIIRCMPSGMIIVDHDLNIQSTNRTLRRMLGLAEEDIYAGVPLFEVIRSPLLVKSAAQVLSSNIHQHNLSITLPSDSGNRYFEFNISGTLLEGEHVLLLMMQDVTERTQSQNALQRFRMALDSSIDAIYLIDRDLMRFIDANETAWNMLGYSRKELLALGPLDLKPNISQSELESRFDEIIKSDTKTGILETIHERKNGDRISVEIYIRALKSEGKDILVAVARDMTSRIEADASLRESEERFRATFSQAAMGLAHVSLEGRWLRVNQKLCEITGYSEEELLGFTFQDVTHPDDLDEDLEFIRKMLAEEIHDYSLEKRYIHKSGAYIWINLTVSLARNADGQPNYFISVIEDISRRKRIEAELVHLVNHDALTGLSNRTLLQDRLSQAISYAARSEKQVAVMFIDLDRFKNINDSLGHDIGDKVIVEAGHRLLSTVRDGDTVARLGGDEFVVVLTDIASELDVSMVAHKALDSLSQPLAMNGTEFYPTASIGISLFPRDGHNAQVLLKNADTAMYRAKDAGRNNYQFYAQDMNARAMDRLTLESGLRRALERKEFILYYQPKVNLVSGEIEGMEALLRWQPPGQKMVSPLDFIPIAEETGLIVPIGEWVLRTACAQYAAWKNAGVNVCRIAVNLSARQFMQQNLVEVVSRVLHETECDAAGLELEITESIIMENPDAAVETLRTLSNMGIKLAIDDFGTGYSSLSYLKRFPIGYLKIDQSFVRDITTDADDAAIATAVIALAHSMKLQVIAEGVETAEQLQFLRDHNCDQMQGYFFSPPLPAEQVVKLLKEGRGLWSS